MPLGWRDFAREAPEYAAFVRGRIEEHGVALLATLRADGSPRISGLEPVFHGDQLWFGMMPRSRKGQDLRRDGRFALHNATVDKDVTHGDIRITGVAVPVAPGEREDAPELGMEAELFLATLTAVSSIQPGGNVIVIKDWRPGRPVRVRERS